MTDIHVPDERPGPGGRSSYRTFRILPTRWSDNDVYGHMNNVVHYGLFDTAINGFLIENGALDISHGTELFYVAETGCRYHCEMRFPDAVTAGIRVGRLGRSSVRYEIGLFRNEDDLAAAEGFFVHVNVDRSTRRPSPLGASLRGLLESLAV